VHGGDGTLARLEDHVRGHSFFKGDKRLDRQRSPVRLQRRHSRLVREPARPAADILGDHLPVQASAVMFPLHYNRKVIRSAQRHCVVVILASSH
jgi:hypothetical protein